MRVGKLLIAAALMWASSLALTVQAADDDRGSSLDSRLARVLRQHDYTGRVESTLEDRLGRRLEADLTNLGRLLWFDNVHSLHRDNTCAGCHSPTNGFGDTQSIAIGVDNNGLVGPNRTGPRNQRRSPIIINTAFYPKLMWNGRFFADAAPGKKLGDPFSNMFGFVFPSPESLSLSYFDHLLQAQAFIPPTEIVEVAGFTGTAGTIGARFDHFDDGHGLVVPPPDGSGFRNDPIRSKVLQILNSTPGYRQAFGRVFPEVRHGTPINFDMFARAIAEFEFALTFATAPIDEFARGNVRAMTDAEKRGALVFFGEGKCISCHATKGRSNEMFSDFQNHVAGVPQLAPEFGAGSNMIFDGDRENEDFGARQISGDPADTYKFRTSPLRNIALSPAFFHNGAFARLEDAIRFHVDPTQPYNPAAAGIDADLYVRMGPRVPDSMLHPLFQNGGIELSAAQLRDVTQFVKTGLLDPRAKKENLCALIPKSVPSKLPVLTFEACIGKPGKKDSN
jgi:cytochrome c peroxidase